MLKQVKWCAWSIILLGLVTANLKAQNFVYTNNDQGNPSDATVQNSVSAFLETVDPMTSVVSLSEIAGSPFSAAPAGQMNARGTRSSFYAPNRIIVVKGSPNDFLYASNAGGSGTETFATVSGFTINASSGALGLIPGSPFATQGVDGSPSGVSLAATPGGTYLYAGTTDGNITIFSINSSTGELSLVGSAPAGGSMSSMKVTPDGMYLAVALYYANEVALFSIDHMTGDLTSIGTISFSPSLGSSGHITGIEVNCDSNLIFAGSAGTSSGGYIDAINFSVDSTGALTDTVVANTTSHASNQGVALVHPNDTALFSSNPGSTAATNTVTPFSVVSGGTLTEGSPASAGSGALNSGGLALSQDGTILYAGDLNAAVSTFLVDSSTTPVSLAVQPVTSTGLLSGLHSVAAYPANACPPPPAPSSSLTASLQVSDGPPPAFDLDAVLTLDNNLVVDPLTQLVTIQIGDFTLTLPPSSFKTFQEGRNAETYLFQGVVESTTLKVQITPLGDNHFQIHALDKQVDLPGLDSPVTVTVGIGGHSASTGVTASFGSSLRGNWRDQ